MAEIYSTREERLDPSCLGANKSNRCKRWSLFEPIQEKGGSLMEDERGPKGIKVRGSLNIWRTRGDPKKRKAVCRGNRARRSERWRDA